MTRSRLLIAALVLICFSCGPIRQPKSSDIVGVYKITAESLETLIGKGYKNIPLISVIIEQNGTMHLENIPDCVFTLVGEGHGRYLTRAARWRCCNEPTFFTLFDGLPLWLEIDGFLYGNLNLKHRTPPYSLNFVIGDPDSGEEVVLEKMPHLL